MPYVNIKKPFILFKSFESSPATNFVQSLLQMQTCHMVTFSAVSEKKVYEYECLQKGLVM